MPITIRDIEWVVCTKYGISKEVMRSRDKRKKISRPRQIIMFLARELTNASYPKIGRHFGRDHTTIVHGVKSLRERMQTNPKVMAHVCECRDAMPSASPEMALRRYWSGRLLEGDVSWPVDNFAVEPARIEA